MCTVSLVLSAKENTVRIMNTGTGAAKGPRARKNRALPASVVSLQCGVGRDEGEPKGLWDTAAKLKRHNVGF